MPFVGSIIPANLAGVEPQPRQAERARDRRRAAGPESAARREDEAELASASGVDGSLPVRSAKGNADEESRDDRTSQGYYDAEGARAAPPSRVAKPRLDIAG